MSTRHNHLYVISVDETASGPDVRTVSFRTTRGNFQALAHLRGGMQQGAIVLGDPAGGPDGPCAIYPQLEEDLLSHGIGSLRLGHRNPGDCVQCAIDTLLGLQYLDDEGVRDVVLVGWSFGASVALAAGCIGRTVRGIAAISPKGIVDGCLRWLRSRPLLLLHGDADRESPVEVSRRVYFRTDTPRRLIIYPGAGHNCDEVRDELRRDLVNWILGTLIPQPTAPAAPPRAIAANVAG